MRFSSASGIGRPWWWSVSSAVQDKPSDERPEGQFSGSVGHSGYPGQYYYYGDAAGGDYPHGVPQYSQHGGDGGPYQSTEESWSSSTNTGGEDEPVLTPVEDEDEVYAFKSRSRYNRKRLSFSQFRYTPTEPLYAAFPDHGKRHHHHQEPVKGGY